MLISVFGTPSPLTYWGIHVMRAVMQVIYGDYHFIKANSIDELREAWDKREGKSVLFVSECPDMQVTNLFIKSGLPVLVFVDHPVDVVCHLIAAGTHTVWDGLCFASQSLCSLREISRSPTAFRFGRGRYSATAHDLVEDIIHGVVGYASEEQIEKVLEIAVPNDSRHNKTSVSEQILASFPRARRPGDYTSLLPSDLEGTIEQVIGQYHPVVTGGDLQQVVWPKSLFSHWHPSGNYHRGPIELLGPARYLIWGPYMHLPRGDWVAAIEIETAENHSGNEVMVDIIAGFGAAILAVGTVDLPVAGVFSFNIEFNITEPKSPIEIRFLLKSGAIEGRFALRQVVLRPVPAQSRKIGTDPARAKMLV
jgi:hypothetical protein